MNYNFNESNKKSAYITIVIYAFFILLIILLLLNIFNKNGNKNTIIVNSLSNIPAPIQKNIALPKIEKLYVNNLSVSIQKLASYDITGRVMSRVVYSDDISPVDYVLGWGPFTIDNGYTKFTSNTVTADRSAKFSFPDSEWVAKNGGLSYVRSCLSNNHLIPATTNIEKQIKSAKIGDYVHIAGYLVYATWEQNGGTMYWGPSSLTRTDTGFHACEIIYVENIEFLKTNN